VNYAKNCPENSGLFCISSQIEKDDETLIIDGGDSLQGTPLMTYYLEHRAEYDFHPMAEGFNEMGLDYYTFGNHDFNFGYDAIVDYANHMNATMVCANVIDKGGKLDIKKHVIHTMADGTKVGITGAVTGYVNIWEQPAKLELLEVLEPMDVLKEEYEYLKDKCDITVCVYHGGFEEDLTSGRLLSETTENQACKISREIGFDILLTGHQHMPVEGVNIAGTYGVQPPSNGTKFCELLIEKKDDAVSVESKLVAVEPCKELLDKILADHSFMEDINTKLDVWLDEPIGSLVEEIAPESKLDAATKGSKVASIFNQVQLDFTGADFSCTSLANDPLGLKKDITVRDVLAIYQFANTVVVKKVTKAVLKEALERCAEYYDFDPDTKSVQISKVFLEPKVEHYNYDFYAGLEYAFDLTRPAGDRVVTLKKLDGTELSDTETYTLATSDYRASGTGGYECIGKSETARSYSEEMPDLLIDFIRRNTPVKEYANSKFNLIF
jgi:2',3'-cyclic-nucleotide 2'-phosphodiesterase/3'-nucleotidase